MATDGAPGLFHTLCDDDDDVPNVRPSARLPQRPRGSRLAVCKQLLFHFNEKSIWVCASLEHNIKSLYFKVTSRRRSFM